jgi:hypothetical protein
MIAGQYYPVDKKGMAVLKDFQFIDFRAFITIPKYHCTSCLKEGNWQQLKTHLKVARPFICVLDLDIQFHA